jgi:hypothetical protein
LAVFRVDRRNILPPLILLFGHKANHDEKCFSVLHAFMSTPISAIRLSAADSWIPAAPLSHLATLLLIAALLPVQFTVVSGEISLIGHGTLLVLIVFVVICLVAGTLLGGPELSDRIVLALSTASRHPGVAMAIVSANRPNQKMVLPAILLYLTVSTIVSGVFVGWLRRRSRPSEVDSRQSPAA